jgi:hypothetical protein
MVTQAIRMLFWLVKLVVKVSSYRITEVCLICLPLRITEANATNKVVN